MGAAGQMSPGFYVREAKIGSTHVGYEVMDRHDERVNAWLTTQHVGMTLGEAQKYAADYCAALNEGRAKR